MSVPGRIRALRKQKNLTVEEVAESIGIHKGHLSRIERGEKSPSLATLEAIAGALNVGMAELFGEKAGEGEVIVVDRSQRRKVGTPDAYEIESLLAGGENRPLSAYVVAPGAKFLEHDVPHHVGQELLFVLKGRIELAIADQLITLEEGDCVSYDAGLQHRLRRTTSKNASVLVVISKS